MISIHRVPKPLQPGSVVCRLAAIICALSIGVLSLLPIHHPDGSNDKINHLIAYFVLTALISWCASRPHKTLLITLGFVSFYGLAIEVLQGMTEYRMFSWYDWLANLAGMSLYLVTLPLQKNLLFNSGSHE